MPHKERQKQHAQRWDVCDCGELIAEFCESHFRWNCADDKRETTGRLRWGVQEGGMGRQETSDTFTFKVSPPELAQLMSTHLWHILRIAFSSLQWKGHLCQPTQTPAKAQGTQWKRGQKECKVWGQGGGLWTVVLQTYRDSCTYELSSSGYLHKVCTRSS